MAFLDNPSAVAVIDVVIFPTGTLPKATLPLSGAEIMALVQNGENKYVNVSDIGAVGGGGANIGVSNLGNTQGNTGVVTFGSVVFAGIGAATLSQATGPGGATISINVPVQAAQSVQTQNLFDFTISGNTLGAGALVSSGTLTLAGGANITLSQAGNAITIVGPAPAGGAFSAGASNLGNTAGSTGVTGTRLVFVGANSVTLSQSTDANGGTLSIVGVASATNVARVESVNVVGTVPRWAHEDHQHLGVWNLSFSGNTIGNFFAGAGSVAFAGGNNITLSGVSVAGGQTVTISAANQTVQTQNLFALTISSGTAGVGALISSGTLTLAAGANITLSQNAGNAITIIGPAPSGGAFSAGVSTGGNTLGSTGISGTQLVLAGGNSITLSQSTGPNGATVTISGATVAAQTAESQTFGMSNLGNTAGTSGVISGPQLRMVVVGGPNITASQSINGSSATISLSGNPAQTVQTQNLHNVTLAGNSTSAGAGFIQISSGTMTLAGGNNITLSQNGNAVTISAASQTVQTQNLFALTISSGTAGVGALVSSGTLTLAGGANITLSQNGGNAITIIGPSPSGGAFSAGASNLGNTAGNTGLSGTQLVLVGTRGISLSQTTGANGATVSIDFIQSVQTQNLVDVTLAGNSTSAGAGFILMSSGTMTLAGGNNITLSQNGNAVTISAASQTVQTQNLVDVTLAGNSTSAGAGFILISSGTMVLAGGNNITLSQNGQSVTISAFTQSAESQSIGASNLGNTLGTSGVASGAQVRAVLVATSNLTISQSVNGASATLSFIANPQFTAGFSTQGNTLGNTGMVTGQLLLVGGANITLSGSTNGGSITLSIAGGAGGGGAFSAGVSTGGNTAGSTGITGTRLVFVGTNNIQLSQSTDANGATISIDNLVTNSFWEPLPAGYQSTTIAPTQDVLSIFKAPAVQGFYSASRANCFISMSISSSSNSSHAGALTVRIGVYTRNVSTLSLASNGSQTYQWSNTSSNSINSLTGVRVLSVPINVNITPGDYWVAVIHHSATTNANWFTARPIVGSAISNQLIGLIGEVSNSSKQMHLGMGIYSAVSSDFPSSIAFSQIQGQGNPTVSDNTPPVVFFGNLTA